MIQSCIFNGIPKVGEEECRKMLEYFYDPDYGNCFTIPPRNSKGEILEAREADFWQEANDLSLLIDVESDELLEKKRSPGIIVTVHDDSSAPDIHTDGHLLGPGHSYTFTIQKQSKILVLNLTSTIIKNHLASVSAPHDDPSRAPIAKSAPMILTSTTPGGFYDEY
ncbi:uncharacterized protein TNCV_4057821 [Trichonephila clavipes]|nr:uncharacterized protein TNCV_4057821 [Trichonephila clavipes]